MGRVYTLAGFFFACSPHIKDGDDMAEIYKYFSESVIKGIDENERTLIAWASKSTIDRDGEVLDASGWVTKEFRSNPVVPLFHDYHNFPMAKSQWEKPDPKDNPIGLLFKPEFAKTQLGDEAFYLYSNGFMNAFSVGFDPLIWEVDGEIYDREKDGSYIIWQKGYIEQKKKKPRCKYLKQILLEISGVLVPANAEALVETRKHVKTPELSNYLDDMIAKERIPMIPVEIDYKQKYIESLEIIRDQALELKKHIDINASDDLSIEIDDVEDIDLDIILGGSLSGSDGDALAEGGDVSEIDLVEMLAGSGDDAGITELMNEIIN